VSSSSGNVLDGEDHDDDLDLSPLGLSIQWSAAAGEVDDLDMGDGIGIDATNEMETSDTRTTSSHLVRGSIATETVSASARTTTTPKTKRSSSMTTHIVRGMPYATMEYA
jgi:hypothetical protein